MKLQGDFGGKREIRFYDFLSDDHSKAVSHYQAQNMPGDNILNEECGNHF
jgi:hypothetical protein